MSEDAKKLIAQLHDFWSRKAAMNALLLMGDEAVPHLIEALESPIPNVQWSARSLLGQIGGDAVIKDLIPVLDDPKRKNDAAEVLRQVTGQSIGPDRAAWEEWLRSGGKRAAPAREAPAAKPSAIAAPLSDKALIDAVAAHTPIRVEERPGGFALDVPLDAGRHQRVTVSFTAKDFEGEPLVVVYTECGPASPRNYEWALRQNLRMSFGAIAIRDRGDQPIFVMVDTHLRDTVTPHDIHKSVFLLAQKGDALEEALTKTDQQ